MKKIKQEITGNNNIQVAGDFIKTEKIQQRNSVTPNYDVHISEAQAKLIKDKVHQMATSVSKEKQGGEFRRIWSLLNDKFEVTSYHLIAKEQFDNAIKFLDKLNAALYRPKLKKTNNEQYRKQMYSAIHARATNLKMDNKQLYEYIERVLALKQPVSSMTELSDTRLKRLYDKIFSEKIKSK